MVQLENHDIAGINAIMNSTFPSKRSDKVALRIHSYFALKTLLLNCRPWILHEI